jgi:DNA/RNA-binding domain of Phe-tRNA-synthetase-like protein
MMTGAFQPRIAEEIWRRHPDYRALSVTARGFSVQAEPHVDLAALAPPSWMDAHLEAWRAAFRGFGANPKKTPSSVDSLWKRLQKDGSLPTIGPVVDLYNALSVRFGAPFGGEDADLYAGWPRLGFAAGSEAFDTTRNGAPVVENPDQGEVVWYDDNGITCRRWNWRQCRRTALSPASRNLWFVIDRLSPMPVEELLRAGEALVRGLREICSEVETSTSLLELGE